MIKEGLAVAIVKIILGVALVGGIFGAGWNVYRRLPGDGAAPMNFAATDSRAETQLTVMVRGDITGATMDSRIEIYPFDLVAAQLDLQATPHLSNRFADFLLLRVLGITPGKQATSNAARG